MFQLVLWNIAASAILYTSAEHLCGFPFCCVFDHDLIGFSVAVCKGDPAIPEFHEKRALRGLDRISSHLDSGGKRKRARSQKENNRLDKKISAFDMGYNRAGKDVIVEEEDQPPKPKKRRLNADQRLALGPVN